MSEIFKPIDGLNGYYISNHGRVKADRVTVKFGKQNKTYPERFLKSWKSKTGYNYIDISVNCEIMRFLLHRLVALYFIDNPEKKPHINHIDGNKNNNHYSNLEWCTASENLKHARDLGLNNSIGSKNKMAKFTNIQISDIRKSNKTITEISKEYGVAIATISRIKSNHIYKDLL